MHCLNESEWEDTLAAAEYYTSDTFVAIPAFEYLLIGWGEINTYNTRELGPKTVAPHNLFERVTNYYDWLTTQPGAIGQWNHPQLYYCDEFAEFDWYSPEYDINMNLVEAYNTGYYDDSYIKALDAGWHVMPASNSDTHNPDWIVGHEMRSVLLAESLTPENLYDAMNECRGYATLDKNLRIDYYLDDAVMGSNLSNPDGTYTAWIKIEDPDGIDRDEITQVDIVTDGGEIIKSWSTSGTYFEETFELESEDARYFFVRVTTASPLDLDEPGVTAWTAPVWTGR
jgi:hypothetical protein